MVFGYFFCYQICMEISWGLIYMNLPCILIPLYTLSLYLNYAVSFYVLYIYMLLLYYYCNNIPFNLARVFQVIAFVHNETLLNFKHLPASTAVFTDSLVKLCLCFLINELFHNTFAKF